ncbi:BTAD domain-containing putative transcriptional regulator [Lentzea sp. BCCO 10_0061]|uniref:BTAD domain-containing putative transcriptional regulator n=1 Tax=Lentzea sokolovensis TaxID=3095429 RepID=A0ABU4UPL3_9PSEU|nr:BTAD domain-containing putative transcriptional regulator [Lentzea sp. BCCO 10_0061]MDX8141381.1 BTAD domain-containing putative transcriptional regulator [Lentzea sp. BCCO 10_0061]
MVAFNQSNITEERSQTGSGLALAVLGSVRAWRDGVELDVGSPQQRLTLAVLSLARGRVVQVSEIIAALWGDREPQSARGTVRTYVHRLRRVLDDDGEALNPLRSSGNGYQLKIDDQAFDLGRFLSARQAAAEARSHDDPLRAVGLLREAIGEWHDDAMAGLPGEWADTERQRLRRLGIQTIETLAELELDLGQSTDVVERLGALAEAEPLRERVHELLMLALYRASRPAEALTVFERLRVTLRDELGVDPGPSLRTLHERILHSDTGLLLAAPAESAPIPPVIRPAQLPAALPMFTGRRTELDELNTRLAMTPAPGVVVVHGTAGVGKTTFAVYWANHASPSYPDGQLYVNLRGFEAGGVAKQPEDVLTELLDALGVPKLNRPASLDALTALYRSALASRRVLVLLDNARTSAQVLPLLPGGRDCLALITSRIELTGLVATTGAHALTLDLMDDQESAELMAARLGATRVAAEPDAVREIADTCARLPLALAVVCARIASNPKLPLSDALHQLTQHAESRLDVLGAADPSTDLRSLLSWSYHALTPQAAKLFRLLSLLPGAEFTPHAAASLISLPLRQATAFMQELTRACLLAPQRGRFSWHDLLRDYAHELLHETESQSEIHAAHRRLLDHYLLLTAAGSRGMDPHSADLPPPLETAAGVLLSREFDGETAVTMFNAACETVLALIRRAADIGFEQHAWHLAWYLRRYLDWAGRIEDLAACSEIALHAARRTQDHRGVGYAHRGLARVAWWHNEIDQCHRHLDAAVAAFAAAGDTNAEAYTHRQAIGALTAGMQTAAALKRIDQARELLGTGNEVDIEGTLLSCTAWCLLNEKRYEEAIKAAHVALEQNEQRGDSADLRADLTTLAYAHAALKDYPAAIGYMERFIANLRDNDGLTGPNYSVSLHGQLTTELVQLARLLFIAGRPDRAEEVQHEALRRLRNELAGTASTSGLTGGGQAVLADLDALIRTDHPGDGWYDACEAILLRVDQVTNSVGPVHWLQDAPWNERG